MNIEINGKTETLDEGISLAALVDQKGLTGKRIAIEVNEELITRKEYDGHNLKEGDQVEIVQAIGGG